METVNLLRNEDIDHIEVITSPSKYKFKSVEQFYQRFEQVTDQAVIDIIDTNL